MKFKSTLCACLIVVVVPTAAFPQDLAGPWDVQLECPGGAIRFGLDIQNNAGVWTGFLINGPERIKIPKLNANKETVKIEIDHYDSVMELRFKFNAKADQATGKWKKRRGQKEWVEMNCSAQRHEVGNNFEPCDKFLGRWAVKFSSSDDPAVGIFKKTNSENRVLGTFLTSTGDYRYLDGGVRNGRLELSCFDGAHAFLFHAELDGEGALQGEFWSSNTWHETWSAKSDPNASLPDEFKQTSINEEIDWGALKFPDLDGKPTRLNDPKFAGKARVIYIFGSWCPNCHDAGAYFSELEKQYKSKGLSILGLAFEMTGDFKRDSEQVKKYLKRHDSSYPVLIAGLSDKKEASKSFPVLDRVRSYPTTIFVDRTGTVRAVHTGFTGPATGKAYRQLKQEFERLINNLLKN